MAEFLSVLFLAFLVLVLLVALGAIAWFRVAGRPRWLAPSGNTPTDASALLIPRPAPTDPKFTAALDALVQAKVDKALSQAIVQGVKVPRLPRADLQNLVVKSPSPTTYRYHNTPLEESPTIWVHGSGIKTRNAGRFYLELTGEQVLSGSNELDIDEGLNKLEQLANDRQGT